MKKKKFSIMLSIATLCLCVAVLAFGVYAAKKASLTTTGSINFEAHNCKVRVLGSVTGAVDSSGTTKEVTKLTDETETSKGKLITGDVTWAVGDIYFDDLNCSNDEIATPIVFTFEMTNESDYPVTADLNLTGDLITKITSNIVSSSSTDLTQLSNGCVLIKNQVATVTLTLLPKTEDSLAINLNNLKLNFEKTLDVAAYEAQGLTISSGEITASTLNSLSSNDVVIPSAYLDGDDICTVTNIGASAFKDNTNITSVTIPSTASIGNNAFSGCTNLNSVNIKGSTLDASQAEGAQASLQSLQTASHNKATALSATALTSTTIEEGTTSIGMYAFQNCTSLTSITIPDSVTSIGFWAFGGCTNLETIVMSNTIETMDGRVFYNTKYVANYSTNTPGENIIYLYNNNNEPVAIYDCIDETIVTGTISLPNSLKCIGESAFSGCKNLSHISIPNSVTNINKNVFYGCSNLVSIIIPDGITSIGSYAFQNCTSLTSITIPNSVTSIGSSAFRGCTNLETIIMSSNIGTMGSNVFKDTKYVTYYSTNHSSENLIYLFNSNNEPVVLFGVVSKDDVTGAISLPNTLKFICESAFEGCVNLTSITIPYGISVISYGVFSGCKGLISITIPSSVTDIGDHAFSVCKGLTSITIPSSVKRLSYLSFYACSNLASIEVDSNNTVYDSRNNCNAIIETSSNKLITGCKNSTIPKGVAIIGYSAFYSYEDLVSITIPSSVTSIESNAFKGTGLTSIVIPSNVKSIGMETFASCHSLLEITISEGLEKIGNGAFIECKKLTSITIPSSVKEIGNYLFKFCSRLNSIVVSTENKIYDSRDNCNAIIETSTNKLISACENSTIPNSVVTIGEYAFAGTYYQVISIPEGVTTIGSYAFEYCTGLTKITIPNSAIEIGNSVFSICNSLKTINYQGTESQWNAITKSSSWNVSSYINSIICTDGTITF